MLMIRDAICFLTLILQKSSLWVKADGQNQSRQEELTHIVTAEALRTRFRHHARWNDVHIPVSSTGLRSISPTVSTEPEIPSKTSPIGSTNNTSSTNPAIHSTVVSHHPLRIRFETFEILSITDTPKRKLVIDTIIKTVLGDAADVWSAALNVKSSSNSIIPKVSEDICSGQMVIPNDLVKVVHADLLLFVTGGACEGEKSQLVFSSPCALDEETDRPVIGIIYFCVDNINIRDDWSIATKEQETLSKATVREIGHVLGMNSDLFPYFRDADGGPRTPRPLKKENVTCVDGRVRDIVAPANNTMMSVVKDGRRRFEIVTETVKRVVRNQFACESLEGARLENQPSNIDDCYGSHWDERLFFSEVMEAVHESPYNILSPLTLALMEDSGWYTANYRAAQTSPFGHGAGCDFVNKKCIVQDEVPDYGKGYFCNTELLMDDETGLASSPLTCDPSHHRVGMCDLGRAEEEQGHGERYFSDQKLTSKYFGKADNCPIAVIPTQDCRDQSQHVPLDGIYYGDDSRCFNFDISQSDNVQGSSTAYCLRTVCDPNLNMIKVFVGRKTLFCEYDGQIHTFPGYPDIAFECPRLATMCPRLICPADCSGKGVCDYSQKTPKCQCFDKNDKSPGCFGSTFEKADYISANLSPFDNWIPPPTSSPVTLSEPEDNSNDVPPQINLRAGDTRKMTVSEYVLYMTLAIAIYICCFCVSVMYCSEKNNEYDVYASYPSTVKFDKPRNWYWKNISEEMTSSNSSIPKEVSTRSLLMKSIASVIDLNEEESTSAVYNAFETTNQNEVPKQAPPSTSTISSATSVCRQRKSLIRTVVPPEEKIGKVAPRRASLTSIASSANTVTAKYYSQRRVSRRASLPGNFLSTIDAKRNDESLQKHSHVPPVIVVVNAC